MVDNKLRGRGLLWPYGMPVRQLKRIIVLQAAAACMNRLAKLSARFIGNQGFSIGIDDVTPAPELNLAKEAVRVTTHPAWLYAYTQSAALSAATVDTLIYGREDDETK
eukprot:scaffold267634_cov14-Prasinocladus_malaysianus.AAC.1